MPVSAGVAYITILPDFSKFAATMQAGVQKGMAPVAAAAATTGKAVGTNVAAGAVHAEKSLIKMGHSGHAIFEKMAHSIGLPLTGMQTLGAAAGIAGIAAVHMASEFDDAMTKLISQVGISREEMEGLKEDVLDMAGSVGRSPQELAEALFFVESAGFRGDEAMQILDASAKAAAIGMGETKSIADALTSALNAYAGTGLTAAHATDVMVAAVREGKFEGAALAPVLGQLLPMASQLGIGFDQMAASLASASRVGGGLARTATGIRFLLTSWLKPSSDAEKAINDVFGSVQDLQSALADPTKGFLWALDKAKDQLGPTSKEFISFTGGARGSATALALVGKNADAVTGIFERLHSTSGDLEKGLEAARHTLAQQWHELLGTLQATLIRIGESIEPFVKRLVSVLKLLTPILAAIADHAVTLLEAFLGYKAVLFLPTLLKSIGTALAAIGFESAAAAATRAGAALAAFGSGPLLAFTAAVVAAKVATDAFAQHMEEEIEHAAEAGGAALDELADRMQEAHDRFETFDWGGIFGTLVPGLGGFKNGLEDTSEEARHLSDDFDENVQKAGNVVRGFIEIGRSAKLDVGRGVEDARKKLDHFKGSAAAVGNELRETRTDILAGSRALQRMQGHLRHGEGAFKGITTSIDDSGDAVARWAGMTRRQLRRWSAAVVTDASEAINAFAEFSEQGEKTATDAVKNAQKQVSAAQQYRAGAKEIVDSNYPAKVKAQLLNAGPEIVRQWGIMSEKQKAAFIDALQATERIMNQTKNIITDKIGDAMKEVERMTSKTIEINTDVDTSDATTHLHQWVTEVQNTKVTVPVDAVFAVGGSVGGLATGGRIPGYGGGDSVLSALEKGEWVINKQAVAKYGDAFFERLNAMRFAGGGSVGAVDDHGWGVTYTLSPEELKSAVIEAARAQIQRLFSVGGPSGLTPTARAYYGAIQTLFHPPIMSTGRSVRKIIGTNTWSQHAYGNALDITNSFASGPDTFKQTIANFLAKMGEIRRDIHYIAYNQRGWVPYGWTAGVTSPHTNHVHADFFPQYSGTPRKRGGPVTKNATYVVGEDGPEMFVPRSSGHVYPQVPIQVEVKITGGTMRLHRDSRLELEDISAEVATRILDYRDRSRRR